MTDNAIIKALECCYQTFCCKECPYHNESNTPIYPEDKGCNDVLMNDTIGLINRQKAEIEKLKKRLDMGREELSYSRELNTQINNLNLKLLAERKTVKSEVIKEFAEKVKAEFCPDCDYSTFTIRATIDTLVKEKTGDTE